MEIKVQSQQFTDWMIFCKEISWDSTNITKFIKISAILAGIRTFLKSNFISAGLQQIVEKRKLR